MSADLSAAHPHEVSRRPLQVAALVAIAVTVGLVPVGGPALALTPSMAPWF